MKTIYTDRYAIRLWIWLLFGAWFLFSAITPPLNWKSAIWLVGSVVSFSLAVVEFKRRRDARTRGEDPSIYKVIDDA